MSILKAIAVNLTAILVSALVLLGTAQARADKREPQRFDIGPQSLATALSEFARQSQQEILFAPEIVAHKRSTGVRGTLRAPQALTTLLAHTGLVFTTTAGGAFLVRLAQAEPSNPPADEKTEARTRQGVSRQSARDAHDPAIFEVLVTASRLLNMDIKRSRDDVQPYVTFDRESIARSGAKNLEEFFKTRLPMNTAAVSNAQIPTFAGNMSQINLRGLGTNQTLILVDGHRTVSPMVGSGNPAQSDVNGIPLEAIERIEVLPSTASGIYGGGATGGVINIVRRRDYSGLSAKITYDNTFDSDVGNRRIDLSAGFAFDEGRTSLLLAGSYSDANLLLVGDRDLVQHGRAQVMQNNSPFFLSPTANPLLGATPNIRSATTVAGALQDLTLLDGTALNSPYTFIPVGYAGTDTDGGAALVANAGRYNLDLPATGQSGVGSGQALLNAPRIESLSATLRRELTANVDAFVDLSAANSTSDFPFGNQASSYTIPAGAPNNPFNQAIRVSVPTTFLDDSSYSTLYQRRGVAGVIVKLPGEWMAETDYTWDRSRFYFRQPLPFSGAQSAAVVNGTIDVLLDTIAFPPDFSAFDPGIGKVTEPLITTLEDATLRSSGPIATLPGGALNLSVLLARRDEEFEGGSENAGFLGNFTYPSRSQTVNSAYLELRAPLVSARNSKPGVAELELQLAGRWDEYTINGSSAAIPVGSTAPVLRPSTRVSSTNPTLGVRYQPLPDVALRASYGTGFVPPTVSQLVKTTTSTSQLPVIDPRRGNAQTLARLAGLGGNPELLPEDSASWTAGIVFTPRSAPGLRLSADYTRIEKTDNIITFTSVQQVVDNEAFLPAGRVQRGPPADDPLGVGIITGVDVSAINIATAMVEAVDVQLDYSLETERFGAFEFFVLATWQPHYQTQLLPTAPVVENVGVAQAFGSGVNPLEYRGNAGVTWQSGPWTLGWSSRYFDAYLAADPASPASLPVLLNQGGDGRIRSQLYHDVFGSYEFSAGFLDRTVVELGVRNLLDEEPPFDASAGGARYYSPFGDPRLASYHVTITKAF